MKFAIRLNRSKINIMIADDRFENMTYTTNLDNAKIFDYFEDAKNYIKSKRNPSDFSIIRII